MKASVSWQLLFEWSYTNRGGKWSCKNSGFHKHFVTFHGYGIIFSLLASSHLWQYKQSHQRVNWAVSSLARLVSHKFTNWPCCCCSAWEPAHRQCHVLVIMCKQAPGSWSLRASVSQAQSHPGVSSWKAKKISFSICLFFYQWHLDILECEWPYYLKPSEVIVEICYMYFCLLLPLFWDIADVQKHKQPFTAIASLKNVGTKHEKYN